MKTLLLKSVLIAAVSIIGLSSCLKKPQVNQNSGGETQFTDLSADKSSIPASGNTRVTAKVQNSCPEITYVWTASSGAVSGNSSQIIFNAPQSQSDVIVTCTVNHPGRQAKTKSITIKVQ